MEKWAYLTVRVPLAEHSFVQTPAQAKAMLENCMTRDPRCGRAVVGFDSRGPNMEDGVAEKFNAPFDAQEVRAWKETAGDELHNIFTNPNAKKEDYDE